jgi:uridine phosphorylase
LTAPTLHLRPSADVAADALLPGDPGRALALAQLLLVKPAMSNHARGLWGYSGRTAAGEELTIQATGMGGPSAALVLSDLAELGVERAVRVGTCVAFGPEARPGELLPVEGALAVGGSAGSFGIAAGETVQPDPTLHRRLTTALGGDARAAAVASLDTMPAHPTAVGGAQAADMQTLAVLATAHKLKIAAAAVLIAVETEHCEQLESETLEKLAAQAGEAAAKALSNLQVEG